MTASTFYNNKEYPYYGRLNGTRGNGAWCPKKNNKGDYLQVDMMKMYSVCALATQGSRTDNYWTTRYKLQFSSNGATWESYKENRIDKVSIFKSKLFNFFLTLHCVSYLEELPHSNSQKVTLNYDNVHKIC